MHIFYQVLVVLGLQQFNFQQYFPVSPPKRLPGKLSIKRVMTFGGVYSQTFAYFFSCWETNRHIVINYNLLSGFRTSKIFLSQPRNTSQNS